MSSIYNPSTIVAYAQQQQEQAATRNQEWVDKQSNTKVLFTYLPKKVLSGTSTELICHTYQTDKTRVLDYGADEFMTKPIGIETIVLK